MQDLTALRNKAANRLQQLKEESRKESGKGQSSEDNRFWRIERDKSGNASAIIRFLPVALADVEDEKALPWVKVYSHGFKNEKTGRWYIEDSLTTINQQDPIAKLNRNLWNEGSEASKDQARKQKRKLNYYSNVLVIKDPQNPENEGKVFLFKYGKKIFEKISNVFDPPESFMEEPSDPFDFKAGRNFKLRIQTKDGYPNYDESTFDSITAISNKNGEAYSEEQINEIWQKEYSLLEFLSPEKFKSYEELERRLNFVMGTESSESDNQQPTRPVVRKVPENDVSNVEEETSFDVADEEISEGDLDKLIDSL